MRIICTYRNRLSAVRDTALLYSPQQLGEFSWPLDLHLGKPGVYSFVEEKESEEEKTGSRVEIY